MKNIRQRIIALCAASVMCGLLAACGTVSDDAATPSSLPLAETTTVASSPSTSGSTPEAPASSVPEMTSDMFENMLASESGRELLISSIGTEVGLEPDAAGCLIDAIPLDVLAQAAESFLTDDSSAFFSPEQMSELEPVFASCNIAAESFAP